METILQTCWLDCFIGNEPPQICLNNPYASFHAIFWTCSNAYIVRHRTNRSDNKLPTQSGINWFLAGINKPNASHLLELVATATVMFVLIYCSARCLPKYYKDWPALRECNINLIIHFDLRICETRSQILTIAGLEASVKNVLHALFVKWCTRRLLLTFTIGSASWETSDAPFFIRHSRKNECWARFIFHLACRWTSTRTDELSKTASSSWIWPGTTTRTNNQTHFPYKSPTGP